VIFLHLVRLGVRPADDSIIMDSVEVYDASLKHDLPGGPCWRRYPFDAYGQKSNCSPGALLFRLRHGALDDRPLDEHRQEYAVAAGRGDLHFFDLPTAELPPGTHAEWTFSWPAANRWEGGENFEVEVV
jgi:glucoamylase